MKRFVVWLLRGLSHLLAGPGVCRFVPSCSHYAEQALEEHGTGRGAVLTLGRLLRCHPWGGHGLDLVPPRKFAASQH